MILLSPSKEMNKSGTLSNQSPFFQSEANELKSVLSKFTIEELGTVLHIKTKVLDTTYEFYNSELNKLRAIDFYNGLAFRQITDKDNNYLKNNLYILSTLYGILNANDDITPYRLDYTIKLLDINLYKYWKNKINDRIEMLNPPFIIDLSSAEYSKVIDKQRFTEIYYSTSFKGKHPSANLKKFRGEIVDYLVLNEISDVYEILSIKTKNICGCTINNFNIEFIIGDL